MSRRGVVHLGRIAAALVLAGVSLPLAGCGFTPLYAENGVSPGLSAIQVVTPEGRVGFLLRQDLDDELAHDKSVPATWRLNMDVGQTRDPRGLREDNTAERYEVQVTVKYTLTEIATGKIATTGQVSSEVSYDAADQPYAGIAAREDTQRRAASDAARRIRLALSTWLAKRDVPAGGH